MDDDKPKSRKLEIVLVHLLVLVIEKTARSAATLAGTEQLPKDRALFSARMANRSRTSTSRSTSTIP